MTCQKNQAIPGSCHGSLYFLSSHASFHVSSLLMSAGKGPPFSFSSAFHSPSQEVLPSTSCLTIRFLLKPINQRMPSVREERQRYNLTLYTPVEVDNQDGLSQPVFSFACRGCDKHQDQNELGEKRIYHLISYTLSLRQEL